jgi:3-oxoacyl-(acyl-carrier-protein) synthase
VRPSPGRRDRRALAGALLAFGLVLAAVTWVSLHGTGGRLIYSDDG